MLKILLTGGGGAGVEAIERLWMGRYEVHFADGDLNAIPPIILVARRHGIPMAGPKWAAGVAELCKHLNIDILIPAVDEELPLVRQLSEMLPKLITLLPSSSFVNLMLDKLKFAKALAAAGIDVPRTVTIDRAKEIGFPCLAKPRHGRGSRGIQILNTADEVDAYCVLARQPHDQLLVQELLQGQEWTVYVSADRAKNLRSVVPVKVNVKRGVTIRAETVLHEGIENYCKAIHNRFPTAGPYNVQLMETTDGRLSAFEINPRISTTLCLAVAAGADPIADFLMSEGNTQGIHPFVSGMQLRRNWANHIRKVDA